MRTRDYFEITPTIADEHRCATAALESTAIHKLEAPFSILFIYSNWITINCRWFGVEFIHYDLLFAPACDTQWQALSATSAVFNVLLIGEGEKAERRASELWATLGGDDIFSDLNVSLLSASELSQAWANASPSDWRQCVCDGSMTSIATITTTSTLNWVPIYLLLFISKSIYSLIAESA